MRQQKRWLLITAVAIGELFFLLLGVLWFCGWLDGRLHGLLDPVNSDVAVQESLDADRAIASVVFPAKRLGIAGALLVVIASASAHLLIRRRYDAKLARINSRIEQLADRRTRTLLRTRNAIFSGLATLAESRDTDMEKHLNRVRRYVTILAQELAWRREDIDETFIANLAVASTLHDVGKVSIPDSILLKPGALTPDERKVIESHATIGGDCLATIHDNLGDDAFLQMAQDIAYSHHEWWDGTGYPRGLRENEIPLAARIVAVADVYDAVTTKRPYRFAMSHANAVEIIADGHGTQFDPAVVEAFLACTDQFQIAAEEMPGSGYEASEEEAEAELETV